MACFLSKKCSDPTQIFHRLALEAPLFPLLFLPRPAPAPHVIDLVSAHIDLAKAPTFTPKAGVVGAVRRAGGAAAIPPPTPLVLL